MARREAYTRVLKENQIREDHVKRMGDIVFKGFQCLRSTCTEFLFVRKDEVVGDFEFQCPKCQFTFKSGEETRFYDYKLENLNTNRVVESGDFSILHDDYVGEAQVYKYCIICNALKPKNLFYPHHGVSRKSKLQGECILCKRLYNSIKNQTRITDQHREAAQKRRMYLDLSGGKKIDSKVVYDKFKYKCFVCGKDLSTFSSSLERPLDHTLPIYYLFPLDTHNATLLCRFHNGEKAGKWPSQYYKDKEQLKKLAVITGIDYQILEGEPFFNPEAINKLKDPDIVDRLLTKYGAYINEIIKLRNRLVKRANFDFFKHSTIVSAIHVEKADKLLNDSAGDLGQD